MTFERFYRTVMMNIYKGRKQAEWCKKKHIFHHIGENCRMSFRIPPLYPKLIGFGNNVAVASGAEIITHDGTNNMLNQMLKSGAFGTGGIDHFQETVGCVNFGSNIFVGTGAKIFYGVNVGDNVVISAGSMVMQDVPSNSVVRGVPAKRICSFDDYVRISAGNKYPDEMKPMMGRYISPELTEFLWDAFYKKHKKVFAADKDSQDNRVSKNSENSKAAYPSRKEG